MPKWEYYAFTMSRNVKLLSMGDWSEMPDLQRLGEEGWELVSVAPVSDYYGSGSGATNHLVFYFKRQKAG